MSMYIFTERHYSYMYTRGSGPRKTFTGDPNKPTEAEKAEDYDSLVAATGSYDFSSSILTLSPVVAKNPSEMNGKSLIYKVEFSSNDTLQMIIVNPPFLPGQEWRIALTRIE